MKYDIAIIGGGPAGYNAAERAAANGLKVVLFEKNDLGGVCLNEGCIPTKTLLYSAKVFDNIKKASYYGISGVIQPELDLRKMLERKNKTVKMLTSGIEMKLSLLGVSIIKGLATIEKEENGVYQIICESKDYTVKYILLCTGSETIIPNLKGLSDIKYWTSKEALEVKELPKTLVIIGGGVVGIEFASFFNSLGLKVVVIEMHEEILGAMDKETSTMLRKEYTKRGVDFRLNTKVTEVNAKQVTIEYAGKIETIDTEQILISVGRKAVTKKLGLEALNIKMHQGGIETNEVMQTNHPNIYACGDVTGVSLLAHTAIREGEVAINHILGINDEMNYDYVPAVVYTNPELASVGKTETELIEAGTYFQVLKFPMTYSGRFVAENEGVSGLFKLITDKDDFIIGCHIYGNPASEIIVLASVAIDKKYTVEEFQKQIFPHPTVSEIFHETLFL